MFQKAFDKKPIHSHFHTANPIILQIDSSGFAIAAIVTKYSWFGMF